VNFEIGGRTVNLFQILGIVLAGGAGLAIYEYSTPRLGKHCTTTDWACDGHEGALVCRDGKYVAAPCRGVKGCRQEGDMLRCDVSQDIAGDVCVQEGAGQCSADGKALVGCANGHVTIDPCRGPAACTVTGTYSQCDNSIATEGDHCNAKGLACSIDGKASLTCSDAGVMELVDHCRGAKGCAITDGKVHCDSSIAKVGDPCDTGAACTEDGAGYLSCDAGAMVQITSCHAQSGDAGCHVDDGKVWCDHDFGRVGDVCSKGALCSEDGKSLLACQDGHFVKDRDCRSCQAKDGQIFCR
jgi:hypothetical protein